MPTYNFSSGLQRQLHVGPFSYSSRAAQAVRWLGYEKTKVLIVGLAPGLHGANATGLPFDGDFAGRFLKQCLEENDFRLQREKVRSNQLFHYECSKVLSTIKSSATI